MDSENESYTFSQLCRAVSRSGPYLARLQKQIAVDTPRPGEDYTAGYVRFMEKVIALRTLAVPLDDIRELLAKEKRILELLRYDCLSASATWYLDSCGGPARSDRHLFLTGFDVGFSLSGRVVQANLNFGARDDELFAGHEMGEDIMRSLRLYNAFVERVRERAKRERPVLENALYWCMRAF
jgi:hypothetical protein